MKIGIFGASGFAREVADICYENLNYVPVIIARNDEDITSWQYDIPIIHEKDIDDSFYGFVIAIGENAIREKIARRYPDLKYINLIHSSATFGRNQRKKILARKGIIVCAGTRFTNNIDVGDFGIYNLNCTIGHDVIIEDFVNIAPGANISGYVNVKNNCWVGTNAAINNGSPGNYFIIGENTIIGSGSLVVKPCEPNSVYVGVPAKKLR